MKTKITPESIRDQAAALRVKLNLLADRLDNIATGVTAPLPGGLDGDYEILTDVRDHLTASIETIDGWFGKDR